MHSRIYKTFFVVLIKYFLKAESNIPTSHQFFHVPGGYSCCWSLREVYLESLHHGEGDRGLVVLRAAGVHGHVQGRRMECTMSVCDEGGSEYIVGTKSRL